MNMYVYGFLFAAVAGMMVYVCLHELLPTAHRYDPKDTVTSKMTFLGMAVMCISLLLFMV